ncbi:hypothetical protein ACHAWU_002104 [Discostella pseudostelligera]|uniref:DDE Tnp4 domain-containing protein n=1 Tax=Discostella pseudostelligera TaxID=259834 RepID=A0ABD3MGJ8_9STRA
MALLSATVASNLPKTLLQCFSGDSTFSNLEQFIRYTKYRRERAKSLREAVLHCVEIDDDYDPYQHDKVPPQRVKKYRSKRCAVPWKACVDDATVALAPEQSAWYRLYVINRALLTNTKSQRDFRRRFRLPFQNYLELVELCKENGLHRGDFFHRWCGLDKVNNKKSSPIELLVLGALRYLGRGWTFDDIVESTCISAEVHRCFLEAFLDFGSTVLYSKYVVTPQNAEEAKTHSIEYEKAGFPGCIGSCDCTHITTEKCQYKLKNNHTGHNKKETTRTFNLTANHRRRILHSTRGGPGRWNDQTMVTYDRFITGLHEGTGLADISFQLFEYNDNGDTTPVKYSGGYVIVDNGYHDWSVTVPPISRTNVIREIRWSKWVESMRKDVECTFGILKGRWRILKCGVRVHGIDKVDLIWLTCCALHNWLLDIDGLSSEWTGGEVANSDESEWLGELGAHDFSGVNRDRIPNAILRLSNNLTNRNFDASGMGPGDDVLVDRDHMPINSDHVSDRMEDQAGQSTRVVKNLTLNFFRRKLIEHFHIMWSRNNIVWPQVRPTNQNGRELRID